MKVAHLSTYDEVGGAAIAAHRTHLGLLRLGIDSRMYVQTKASAEPEVSVASRLGRSWGKVKRRLDGLAPQAYSSRDPHVLFSASRWPDPFSRSLASIPGDLLHFHWICNGFYRIEALRCDSRPRVWTFHDMWAFTGGCHYAGACRRYEIQCGACPALGSRTEADLSRSVWERKRDAGFGRREVVVCPSRWLAECTRKSTLFRDARIEVIPYGLDLDIFRPRPASEARSQLGLPPGKKLILFGALGATSDPRKGFQHLAPALQALKDSGEGKDWELVVFGGDSSTKLPLPTTFLGEIRAEERLALAYAAADVFVAPSEQDNLPNTVLESLGCGTPVVAFAIGGMPDMVRDGENGYLAEAFDPRGLAAGIRKVLVDDSGHDRLRRQARGMAEREFALTISAKRYLDLYHSLTATLIS